MKKLMSFVLGLAIASSLTVPAFAEKPIKEDVKDAGKATGRAAKKTGKAIARGTKKGVNKTAEATAGGAEKLEKKTR